MSDSDTLTTMEGRQVMIGRDARELAARISAAPQGGTWHVGREDVVTLSDGFVVGGVVPSRTVGRGFRSELATVDACAAILSDARHIGAAHVGYWTDDRTGVLWLDVVDVVDSRELAVELAAQRGELAVWDAGASVELRVTA